MTLVRNKKKDTGILISSISMATVICESGILDSIRSIIS
jgi:hypothetical protein